MRIVDRHSISRISIQITPSDPRLCPASCRSLHSYSFRLPYEHDAPLITSTCQSKLKSVQAPSTLRRPSFEFLPSLTKHKRNGRCTLSASAIRHANHIYSLTSSSLEQRNGWIVSSPNAVADPVDDDYEAIMVLGGGLCSDGSLPPWVIRRLDGAVHIYNQHKYKKPKILLLGAGTPHKPSVCNAYGYVVHESTAYATYLMDHHDIPPLHLLKETSSYDTVGNGYFSLTMHALPCRWKRISVVTSQFHMPRTQAIFKQLYLGGIADVCCDHSFDKVHFHPVSDEGLFPPDVSEARAEKEAAAVKTWHGNMSAIKNLKEFHEWMYTTHLCYAVARQNEFGVADSALDPKLAATY